MTLEQTKQISTIGGGLSATSIVILQALHYAEARRKGYALPPLVLQLNDQYGAFGSGIPYQTSENVFSLNQNASAMSPFTCDPEHFTRYSKCSPEDFLSRAKYGTYIKDTLARTEVILKMSNLSVTFERNVTKVNDFDLIPNGWELQLDGSTTHADAVILADGHQKSHIFDQFKDNRHFFGDDFSVAQVEEALKVTDAKAVGIIGTGARMVDTLRVLDSLNFKGTIYAFSRDLVEPWRYNPVDYQGDKPIYKTAYLNKDTIGKNWDRSFSSLKSNFYKELLHAKENGYQIGHALVAINLPELKEACSSSNVEFEKFHDLYRKTYGNPTSPESYELYQNLKKSGQLQLIQANVSPETLRTNSQGFILEPHATQYNLPVLPLIFNGATYSRNPFASPLVSKAVENDWLAVENGAVTHHAENQNGLYVAGVPTKETKWGVETFRDHYDLVARQSFQKVFQLDKTPDWQLRIP